jgi:hypothetical protein
MTFWVQLIRRDDLARERRTAWYRTRIRLILPHRIVILKTKALALPASQPTGNYNLSRVES